jgi:aspartate aminotransferase-like enzyme
MRASGFTLTGGLGDLAERVIRIGHMGDLGPEQLEAMLEALAASTCDVAHGDGFGTG